MQNGIEAGILLLLGTVISGLVLALNGVVELFSKWVKAPKGAVNFVTGIIVASLAFLGMRCLGG